MSAPEKGKRYRIEAEVVVSSVGIDTIEVVGMGFNDSYTNLVNAGKVTWTEVEPEYVVGALYMQPDGVLWKRWENASDPLVCVWAHVDDNAACAREGTPLRPLTRLYREDER